MSDEKIWRTGILYIYIKDIEEFTMKNIEEIINIKGVVHHEINFEEKELILNCNYFENFGVKNLIKLISKVEEIYETIWRGVRIGELAVVSRLDTPVDVLEIELKFVLTVNI